MRAYASLYTVVGWYTAILSLFSLVCRAEPDSSSQAVKFFSPLASTNKTLILFDKRVDDDFSVSHTELLKLIKANGFSYELQAVGTDADFNLFDELDHRLYDNVIVMPSKARILSNNVDYKTLEKFAKHGGNTLLVTNSKGSQTDVSIFLNQLGIFPSPKNFKFIDYHSTKSESGYVEEIDQPTFLNSRIVPHSIQSLPYSDGAVAILDNNEYLVPLLQASETSFTYDLDRGSIDKESTWHSGSQGYLLTGYQARDNARTVWAGSEEFFSDGKIDSEFVDSLLKWAFRINGVIRSDFVQNNKVTSEGQTLSKKGGYKVKDYCKFEIGLSQWAGNEWIPYNATDVQLEFIMLDPYYRLNLQQESINGSAATYGTLFQIPDHHGMFTFKVDYSRPGLTFVKESEVVPVRHLANDEFPRSWSITNSWVYLASFFAVVLGWLVFVFLYIFSGKKSIVADEKKKQ